MRSFERLADLEPLVGQEIAVSDWITVSQERIQLFARSTSRWIHWWSFVASAKSWIRSCVTVIHSLRPISWPTRSAISAIVSKVLMSFSSPT